MDYNEYLNALWQSRNQALHAGRPLSQNEAANVSQQYFQNLGQRQLQSQAISFDEKHGIDQLALAKLKNNAMLKAANQSSRNSLISNLLNTGGSLAALKYYG